MNKDFPFTKEELLTYDRDSLVSLAKYHNVVVRRKDTNTDIVNKLWEKYYPEVIICGNEKFAVRCEQHIDENGDEIIFYQGRKYNLSKMAVRVKRAFAGRMRRGE